MKKHLCLVLCVASLLTAAVGCSTNTENSDAQGASSQVQESSVESTEESSKPVSLYDTNFYKTLNKYITSGSYSCDIKASEGTFTVVRQSNRLYYSLDIKVPDSQSSGKQAGYKSAVLQINGKTYMIDEDKKVYYEISSENQGSADFLVTMMTKLRGYSKLQEHTDKYDKFTSTESWEFVAASESNKKSEYTYYIYNGKNSFRIECKEKESDSTDGVINMIVREFDDEKDSDYFDLSKYKAVANNLDTE